MTKIWTVLEYDLPHTRNGCVIKSTSIMFRVSMTGQNSSGPSSLGFTNACADPGAMKNTAYTMIAGAF